MSSRKGKCPGAKPHNRTISSVLRVKIALVLLKTQSMIRSTRTHLRQTSNISAVMRRSIRKFNIPPGQPPGHLNFWRLACSNSLPSGQKSRSNAPPISTELPLLRDKFRLQSNILHAFQREICRNDTFNLLLKTLLKEIFTNKGEHLSCKSVKPCKTEKTHGRITSEEEINPVQIPHPSNATFKFPPPRARFTVKCPGYARGDVEVSNWSAHYQPYVACHPRWKTYSSSTMYWKNKSKPTSPRRTHNERKLRRKPPHQIPSQPRTGSR